MKTWLYKILIYRARARGERERRTTPFSALEGDDSAPSVPTERFRGSDALWAGHWATPPKRWDGEAEARAIAGETKSVLDAAIVTDCGVDEDHKVTLGNRPHCIRVVTQTKEPEHLTVRADVTKIVDKGAADNSTLVVCAVV